LIYSITGDMLIYKKTLISIIQFSVVKVLIQIFF